MKYSHSGTLDSNENEQTVQATVQIDLTNDEKIKADVKL